eukprot:tig00000388_g24825.t1
MEDAADAELELVECRFGPAEDQMLSVYARSVMRETILSENIDLTGHMIWPGARLCLRYLHWLRARDCFGATCTAGKIRTAVELGAGSGLPGVFCALQGARAVLTDGLEHCLPLMRRNAELHSQAPGCGPIACERLWWGDEKDTRRVLEHAPGGYDLVICADIIYPDVGGALPELMATCARLLAPGGTVLVSYVPRSKPTSRAFVQASWGAGLEAERVVQTESFAPEGEAALAVAGATIVLLRARRPGPGASSSEAAHEARFPRGWLVSDPRADYSDDDLVWAAPFASDDEDGPGPY